MQLTGLRVTGFRNLDGYFRIPGPLGIIVGENNAGKSNLVDAIRLVLTSDDGPSSRPWIRASDFTHDAAGDRTTDEFEIEAQFSGLSDSERGRMVTCLSPRDEDCEAKIRLTARLRDTGRVSVQLYGGDSKTSDIEPYAREAAVCTFLPPLRDAASELRPGRSNQLVDLVKSQVARIPGDDEKFVDLMKAANTALGEIESLRFAREGVEQNLEAMTGGGRYRQRTALEFDDPVFNQIVNRLRAKIGGEAPLSMDENGLGFNNLLYMAVLIAAFGGEPVGTDPCLRVLVIEEPEAHLHPQLQELLAGFLETSANGHTQLVATSHSPNLTASVGVERLAVLSKDAENGSVLRSPGDFGIAADSLRYLRRFVDATKSSLFFARGVIFVEGISEQLLVPELAQRAQHDLAAEGISVVNIGGVAFKHFMELFGEDRLPARVAVVSDSDPGERGEICGRAANLKELETGTTKVFLSNVTLERDLAVAENLPLLAECAKEIRPIVGKHLLENLPELTNEDAAKELCRIVEDFKGEFALCLSDRLSRGSELEVPDYLKSAIEWVIEPAGDCSRDATPGDEVDESESPSESGEQQ